jgi:hypothetical protein
MFRDQKNRLSQISRSIRWKSIRKSNNQSDETDTSEQQPAATSSSRKRKAEEGLQSKFSRAVKRMRTDVVSILIEDIQDVCHDEEVEISKMYQNQEDNLARQHSAAADRLTKSMSVEEYIEYSKCREASFTYNNTKRFKDWLGLNKRRKSKKKEESTTATKDETKPISVQIDDQLVEVFGHVAWETVGLLTQAALIVKRDMNMAQYTRSSNRVLDQVLSEYVVERNIGLATGVMDMSLRKSITYFPDKFFTMLDENDKKHYFNIQHVPHQARQPIESTHIIEAVRRLNIQKGSLIDFTYTQRVSNCLH